MQIRQAGRKRVFATVQPGFRVDSKNRVRFLQMMFRATEDSIEYLFAEIHKPGFE